MARLIETHGGRPLVAPSMREVPVESNTAARDAAQAVIRGDFDLVVLLTGVGTRAWLDVVATAGERDRFIAALRQTKVAVRGPKPAAVMRELEVPVWVTAPEPNTWRELLMAIDRKRGEFDLVGRRVALQEYGDANAELLVGLEARRATVTRVAVYRWALPEDVGPLQQAMRAIAAREVDVALFTTATQVVHLLQVARTMGLEDVVRDALQDIVVASIGPTTSDELREQRVDVDMEPSHPKMGILVREAAERVHSLR